MALNKDKKPVAIPDALMGEAAPKVNATAKAAPAKSADVVSRIVSKEEVAEYTGTAEVNSMSDSLAYVCALGDPSVIDTYKLDGVPHRAAKIIGYRFRATRDVEVPDFGTTPAFSGNQVMDAANVTEWKTISAGEEVDLTRVEVAALLTKPEFGFVASGNPEAKVKLALGFKRVDPNQPVQSVSDLPDAQLQLEGKGSIKSLPILNVLEYTSNVSEDNKFATGTRKILPEFEGTKFENLAKTGTRSGRRGGAKKTNEQSVIESRLEKGAAFQKLLAQIG